MVVEVVEVVVELMTTPFLLFFRSCWGRSSSLELPGRLDIKEENEDGYDMHGCWAGEELAVILRRR